MFLEKLACPHCNAPLQMQNAHLNGTHILDASLSCSCGYHATIQDGILLCTGHTDVSRLKVTHLCARCRAKCHPEWWHGSRRSRKVKRPEYGFRSGEHSAFGAEHCNAGRPVFPETSGGFLAFFFFREAVLFFVWNGKFPHPDL